MAGQKNHSRRKRRKRKLIVFVVELIILAVLASAVVVYHKFDLINSAKLDKGKIGTNELSDAMKKTFEGYTTIALFGLDNRTQGVYTTGNSDVIMVLNINNDTKEVQMVSVYRDTYLNVAAADEAPKYNKANAAYAYGGPEQAVTMLNRNLDLDIDNYVSFDFSAVASAIDILGGVDIEITSDAELGYLNDYIEHTNGILGTSAKRIDSVGKHTLDGVQAVAYSRIRYTKGGDFKRAERQRRVFSQMVKKAKKANPVKLNALVEEVFPKIETDLERNDIISMVIAMIGYDMSDSRGFPFDKKGIKLARSQGGDVVVPCDLENNVERLHKLLFEEKEYEVSADVKAYSADITNITGYTKESGETDEFSEADDFDGTKQSGEDGQTE